MVEQLYSIRDCGKAVGVAAHQIAYAHTQERLAEPQYRIAGKRIYTAEDVRRRTSRIVPDAGRRGVTVPESFIYRRVGTLGCEILADGEVIAWTVDEPWATIIVGLLDGAEEGDLRRQQDMEMPETRPPLNR
jgi:hypothetical protein